MLTSVRAIRADPLAFLAEQWRQHGDVVQFPIPSPPTYLIAHPADVRAVLVDHARETTKDTIQYRALSKITGAGLLTSDAENWKRHRRVLQPAFHRNTLPRVAEHTKVAAAGLLRSLADAGPAGVIDIEAVVSDHSLLVVGAALFGSDLTPMVRDLGAATMTALAQVVASARMPIRAPIWVPTPGNRRMARAQADLDLAVSAILDHGVATGQFASIVDLMHSGNFTTDEMREEIITFLVAGHETVVSALTWALLLVAQRPEIGARICAQAAAILGPTSPIDNAVTAEQLGRLTIARAVMDESMRLYPPAWLISRRTETEMSLGGRRILQGSLLILSPWLTHRHPSAWDRPEHFNPDRFLDPNIRDGSIRRAYFPFGLGPRMCIGRDFAYAQSVLTLSLICQEFELDFSGPLPPYAALVTLRPGRPALISVTPRRLSDSPNR